VSTPAVSLSLGTGANLGRAKNVSKPKRFGATDSGLRQDFVFDDSQSEGAQRRPCILGNFELHHFLIETSILDYSQHMDKMRQLPEWTKAYGEWTAALKLELKRGKI
jgi:hypothetical protein